MCGFSGFIQFGGAALDRDRRLSILRSMGAALSHRGPDDEQFYDDGVLSLVYRRLSIVDPSGGRQPFFNEDATRLLVCNGQIYNHAELRESLRPNHQFKTNSDCEVLLHGFEEWQEKVLQRTRGMFALATWDIKKQVLFLARDRLGIKPLYVCHLPNGILFGSELKALLVHPNCPREMDWRDLSGNPIAQALTPTFVKGIEYLPGASYMVIRAGHKPVQNSYWEVGQRFNSAPFGMDAKRYVSEFDGLLQNAMAEHMQGESEVGLHLSGGVDSSLLAALAAPIQPDMPSYTIVERSNFLAGDAEAARKVAATLGLNWSPVLFDYRTLLDDSGFSLGTLEQASWMMDSPLFDIEWVLKRQLNQLIRNRHPDLKVLLLGQGADEFSGGYSKRIDAPYTRWSDYLRDEVQYFLNVGSASEARLDARHSVFMGKRNRASGISPYQQMMRLMPRQLQNHNLWHEDRTSSCFGMEARVPFLDHRLVEFLASVPVELHKKLFWNKAIIRQVLHKHLPDYDAKRPKVGFCWTDDSRSLDIIIHNMACRASAEFRERYMDDRNYPFDRAETERLIQQVQQRQPGFRAASVKLLGQMSTSIFRRNVTQAPSAAVAHSASLEVSRLEIVNNQRWPEMEQHFLRQPVMPYPWTTDHCPQIPAGCRLQETKQANGKSSYRLVEGQMVHAEVQAPVFACWFPALVAGLGDSTKSDYTVQDWMNHLSITQAELTDVLGILLECGMVTVPAAPRRLGPLSRLTVAVRRRLTPRKETAPSATQSSMNGWFEKLSQRKQQLEAELRR